MSGFEQDINQLQPNFYRVVLTLNGGTGTYPTADGDDNGAVFTQDHSQFTTLPTTLANARRVARGHLRFLSIIEEVKKYADAQILDIEFTSTGATAADNQPTQVKFTVRYDRDANVLPSVRSEIGSPFQFTPTTGGAVTVDSTAKAVRYLVGEGLDRHGYVRRVRVYDPVQVAETDKFIEIDRPDTLADMYDDIAVTLIDGTTVINP
jgi:hypothetical protein